MRKSKALCWDELAKEYDKCHSGRKARTLRMATIFEWAKTQKDMFYYDNTEGTVHRILK